MAVDYSYSLIRLVFVQRPRSRANCFYDPHIHDKLKVRRILQVDMKLLLCLLLLEDILDCQSKEVERWDGTFRCKPATKKRNKFLLKFKLQTLKSEEPYAMVKSSQVKPG